MKKEDRDLIRKYNIPGPRYTSYPTVPYWEVDDFTHGVWLQTVKRSFEESNQKEGISLYIHLPFCENLCTFCACNKHITKRHSVEEPYIRYLLKEWQMYLDILPDRPILTELHLGGGTPTFFSPIHLKQLLDTILSTVTIEPKHTFSFEGHPNHTSREHFQTLYDLGFHRTSFGVQDYDPKVQKAINRIQSFERVKLVTEWAKEIGYSSVCHEFVYGLPFQSLTSVAQIGKNIAILRPDRVINYSYAHVPWKKGLGQRGFNEIDLPSVEFKQLFNEKLRGYLKTLGYQEIGMDHFALSHDSLYQSLHEKKICRNFMGYTHSKTQLMISLGVSAIADSRYAFAQNTRDVKTYYQWLDQDRLPIFRGHILSTEDLIIRRHILNLMCKLETDWAEVSMQFEQLPEVLDRLDEIQQDGLIKFFDNGIHITEIGRSFLRNICMAFDLRLIHNQTQTRIFSMTI
ncbi:MAG: oxygen-independent coproporphyrinogen III oxidase [Flavobacteriales bacterium AspAUS03]